MNYQRAFGSKYPAECIASGYHRDIDNNVIALVNQYNEFILQKDTASAYNLYKNNESILKPYVIDMAYINYLEEEIHNTGIAALLTQNTIVSATEPGEEQITNSYWLQEY